MLLIPRKIENPLREGLVSKVYLCGFEDFVTSYSAAPELGVEPRQVIGEVKNRFPNLFERIVEWEKRKPFRSKVDPFLQELEEDLAEGGAKLEPNESQRLREYLDGPFRKATADKYLEKDYGRPVNAYSELLSLLLHVARVENSVRESVAKQSASAGTPEEELRADHREVWREISKEPELGPVPWDDAEILEPVTDFPDELLDKLKEVKLVGANDLARKFAASSKKFWSRVCEDDQRPERFRER